jgi:hypothetical protein
MVKKIADRDELCVRNRNELERYLKSGSNTYAEVWSLNVEMFKCRGCANYMQTIDNLPSPKGGKKVCIVYTQNLPFDHDTYKDRDG